MSPEDRKKIEKALNEEIAKIEKELPQLQQSSQPVAPDDSIGRLTRMEAMQAANMSKAALDKSMNRLSRLKGALARIDQESFGICTECEEIIPVGRLLLMPESQTCVNCSA